MMTTLKSSTEALALRPQSFAEYVGQERLKRNSLGDDGAKKRGRWLI